jgi:hypothetical protein
MYVIMDISIIVVDYPNLINPFRSAHVEEFPQPDEWGL